MPRRRGPSFSLRYATGTRRNLLRAPSAADDLLDDLLLLRGLPKPAEAAIGPSSAYGRENLPDSPTARDTASRAGFSEKASVARFREVTATSPSSWVAAHKVLAAWLPPKSGDHPLEEVARECGFRSLADLRRAFQRSVGMGPRRSRIVHKVFAARRILETCDAPSDAVARGRPLGREQLPRRLRAFVVRASAREAP